MKFPKNRDTTYLVYRKDTEGTEVSIAVFRTLEAADNYADTCEQEMRDRGYEEFKFLVSGITYYDE
jgi:hypothetical protein